MPTIVPPYVGALYAVIERFRALLPRRDLELEVRLKFPDRRRIVLSVLARRSQLQKECDCHLLDDQYMALRAEHPSLCPAIDKAITKILEELFPDELSPQNGFRGVRYWTWNEKRIQEEPRGK